MVQKAKEEVHGETVSDFQQLRSIEVGQAKRKLDSTAWHCIALRRE
jgi:hypothetical protein